MVNKKKIFKTLGLTMAAAMLMVTPAMAEFTAYHFEVDMEYGNEEHTNVVEKDNDRNRAYVVVDDSNIVSTDRFYMSVNGPYFYNYNYTGDVQIFRSTGFEELIYTQEEKPKRENNYRLRGVTKNLSVRIEGRWEP